MVQVFWHVEPFRCAQQQIQDSPFAVNSAFEEDHMSDTAIGLVVFAFAFGGAVLGLFLRTLLPQHHLSADSKDIVRLGMAFVVTTTALVLGLLVASAKAYFEKQATELTAMSAKVVLLDRVLAGYGPEAKDVRAQLHADVVLMLDQLWSEGGTPPAPSAQGIAALFDKVQELSPRGDAQRSLQAQALNIALALGETRWLMYEQSAFKNPKPLLVILASWLTIIFISFGLFASKNATVLASLFFSALAVSGAVFLALEGYTPFAGWIRVSSVPLRAALALLGQ
jgi:hypothetical protein